MENNMTNKQNNGGESALKGSCLWGILLFFILVIVDQLTKIFADAYFSQPNTPDRIAVIPDWIYLCITYNKGISYGMGANAPTVLKMAVIVGTAVLMSLFAMFYFQVDKRRTLLRIAIVFVVAGGVGNLIDRIYFEVWDPNAAFGVRDMVDLNRFGFAVCNFADFFISAGAVMLVLSLLFFDKDAIFPLTKKYKELAKEAAEEEERKQAEKAEKKAKETQGKE